MRLPSGSSLHRKEGDSRVACLPNEVLMCSSKASKPLKKSWRVPPTARRTLSFSSKQILKNSSPNFSCISSNFKPTGQWDTDIKNSLAAVSHFPFVLYLPLFSKVSESGFFTRYLPLGLLLSLVVGNNPRSHFCLSFWVLMLSAPCPSQLLGIHPGLSPLPCWKRGHIIIISLT